MKYLAAVLALAATAPARSGPTPAPQRPPVNLRQSVQQFQRYDAVVTAAPRQLSPGERAQLRRQLSEYAQPTARPR